MLFDVQAALAEILNEAPARCDSRDSCDLYPSDSRKSQESQSQVARNPSPAAAKPFTVARAAPPVALPPNRDNRGNRNRNASSFVPLTASAPSSMQDDARPDADGFCRTWTGRIVRLDELRDLTAWDRNGPAGRLFCGICKQWVDRDTGCSQPECWKGGAA